MGFLKSVSTQLQEEESKIGPALHLALGKQFVSKLTLIAAATPPIIYALIAYFIKLNISYIIIFLCLYFVFLYWIVETKFDSLHKLSEYLKNLMSKYV